MGKFGQPAAPTAAEIWAAATRTLTDFSAEELFDLPIAAAVVPTEFATPSSGGTADVFGDWVEVVADVGVGKRLIGFSLDSDAADCIKVEVEFGEGASGSEAAVARFAFTRPPYTTLGWVPLWKSLSDNARLSVRVRDDELDLNAFTATVFIV